MRKLLAIALVAAAAACLPAAAGAQGFGSLWGCTVNGWPCWMALPLTGDSGKVLTYDATLRRAIWSALPPAGDPFVGNEVVGAADGTLTRSGTGTEADPYKLALNLGNANTWVGLQTLSNGTTSAGRLAFLEDADNGTQSATLYGPASLDSDISVTLPSEAGTLALQTGTSTITVNKPDIRTTLTDGLVLANTTPATSGVPMQYSPALRLEGHVWASGAGSDDKWEWYQYIQPEAGPSTSSWATFVSSKNGGPLNTALQFSSTGILIASALRISPHFQFSLNGAAMSSAYTYSWSATSSFSYAKDLSIGRNSPNVLGITRGNAAGAGSITARNYMVPLVADATVQYGQVVMPSASTDGRFVAATKDDTLAIGVFSGLGPSASGTKYNIVLTGIAHVVLAEDQAVTRGQYLCIDASTAGYAAPSSSLCAQGKGIGKALYSEPVSYTIDPAGCGGSCVNTSTDTITLASAPDWAVDDPVVYWASGGTSIGGLVSGHVYWIHSITGAAVTLKATKDATVKVDLTSAGNDATQYVQRLPQAIVNIQ